MFSDYIFYYEKFRKVIQQTENESLILYIGTLIAIDVLPTQDTLKPWEKATSETICPVS